ncbi:MAG: hypothetical protein HQM16_18370 [Deltaproteobacteria bacterium]|nr:hypothetical protein [Deltaproteobacteria bacterium]
MTPLKKTIIFFTAFLVVFLLSCSGHKNARVAPSSVIKGNPYMDAVGEDWLEDNSTADEPPAVEKEEFRIVG